MRWIDKQAMRERHANRILPGGEPQFRTRRPRCRGYLRHKFRGGVCKRCHQARNPAMNRFGRVTLAGKVAKVVAAQLAQADPFIGALGSK